MSATDARLLEATTALLGIAGVFTGSWHRVREQPNPVIVPAFVGVWLAKDRIRGLVAADVAGVLTIQESNDAAVVNRITNLPVPAGIGLGLAFDVLLTGQYVRIIYTNGAGAQAAFTLQVWAE